jgi:hypothetical protein
VIGSECTDTWVAAQSDWWDIPANWSAGRIPTSTDIACAAAGSIAKVEEGEYHVGALRWRGTLEPRSGKLYLGSQYGASSVADLDFVGGTLYGPGSLVITEKAYLGSGWLEELGSFTIPSGTTAAAEHAFTDVGTKIDVYGTLQVGSTGSVSQAHGAVVENLGQIELLGGTIGPADFTSEESSELINDGTVKQSREAESLSPESHSHIQSFLRNSGTVLCESGRLSLYGGGSSAASTPGAWTAISGCETEFQRGNFNLAGTVPMTGHLVVSSAGTGARVAIGAIAGHPALTVATRGSDAPEALLEVGAELTVPSLALEYGHLRVAGVLNVEGPFNWIGALEGTGNTYLNGNTTANGSQAALIGRTMYNRGRITWGAGDIAGENAELVNEGELIAAGESYEFTPEMTEASAGSARLVNRPNGVMRSDGYPAYIRWETTATEAQLPSTPLCIICVPNTSSSETGWGNCGEAESDGLLFPPQPLRAYPPSLEPAPIIYPGWKCPVGITPQVLASPHL